MGLSWPHILIVVLLFILLFGRGKISDLMGDVAKGIKSFKQGLADEPEPPVEDEPEVIPPAPKTIEHKQAAPAARTRKAAAKPKAAGDTSGTTSRTGKTASGTSSRKTSRTRNSG